MKQGFNLLKPQVEAPSIWTTLYNWVVGTARIVLIITETAVIAALFIRIVIDVQGKDLDEKISNYENIIQIRSEEETKYLKLQSRTADYRDSFNKNYKFSNQMNEFIKNIPLEFNDVVINFIDNKIVLTGKALNVDIKEMENYLKTSDLYTNSQLISFDIGDGLSDFDFQTQFKELPNRQLIKE